MSRRLSTTFSPTADTLLNQISKPGWVSSSLRRRHSSVSQTCKPIIDITRTAPHTIASKVSLQGSQSKAVHDFITDLLAVAKTLYLFTASDLKTILYPSVLFATSAALSPALTTQPMQNLFSLLVRLPLAAIWIWLNLLAFCIGNQRLPHSVLEDKVNKPWRPIPSRRLTPQKAQESWITAHIISLAFSLAVGQGLKQWLAAFVLGYIYNDLRGGDRSIVLRNLCNAGGILAFGTGAAAITIGEVADFTGQATLWFWVLAGVVMTTIQGQDMYDQEGDRENSRRTIPLICGDRNARLSLVAAMCLWSLFVPIWWCAGYVAFGILALLGVTCAGRWWMWRDVKSDKLTAKIWTLWMVALYVMPLYKI